MASFPPTQWTSFYFWQVVVIQEDAVMDHVKRISPEADQANKIEIEAITVLAGLAPTVGKKMKVWLIFKKIPIALVILISLGNCTCLSWLESRQWTEGATEKPGWRPDEPTEGPET